MKVLKPGPESMSMTCSGRKGGKGCGAQLEITPEDVVACRLTYFDESSSHVYVTCPQCGTRTDLPEDASPSITNLAWEKYQKQK